MINRFSQLPNLNLESCQTNWWASSGHAQTILSHFIKSPSLKDLGEKMVFQLEDGDQLVGFCHPGTSDTVVSLFHGLSGDADGDYMRRTALLCEQMGHTCVRMNHRNAGAGEGFAKKFYHSGRSEDISAVLQQLRNKFPGKKQIAIGFSMSGNMLLLLLTGQGRGGVLPDAAITVNAAINLDNTAQRLRRGFNRVYDWRFVNDLAKRVQDTVKIPFGSSIYDFDKIYTAKEGGFRDREEYYSACSTKAYVDRIKTPTYVLTTADDPIIHVHDYKEAAWSEYTNVHIETRGGHLGYWSAKKNPLGSRRWLDYYLTEALKSLNSI